jgi:hypothetical protein
MGSGPAALGVDCSLFSGWPGIRTEKPSPLTLFHIAPESGVAIGELPGEGVAFDVEVACGVGELDAIGPSLEPRVARITTATIPSSNTVAPAMIHGSGLRFG